jgi:hypothetical protein
MEGVPLPHGRRLEETVDEISQLHYSLSPLILLESYVECHHVQHGYVHALFYFADFSKELFTLVWVGYHVSLEASFIITTSLDRML